MFEKDKIVDLYRNYRKELFIYIYRFTSSHENSEDILHDCFVNLIKYSHDHEIKENSIRAFLYKTAHNLSINFLKRNTKFEFSSIEERINGNILQDDNTINDIFDREMDSKIYKILENTDELSKSIFVMKKELNLSLDEIADFTGYSDRTVRRKLQKTVSFILTELKKSDFI